MRRSRLGLRLAPVLIYRMSRFRIFSPPRIRQIFFSYLTREVPEVWFVAYHHSIRANEAGIKFVLNEVDALAEGERLEPLGYVVTNVAPTSKTRMDAFLAGTSPALNSRFSAKRVERGRYPHGRGTLTGWMVLRLSAYSRSRRCWCATRSNNAAGGSPWHSRHRVASGQSTGSFKAHGRLAWSRPYGG
jgi:hypothetical protein